jgi:hypothetical protein
MSEETEKYKQIWKKFQDKISFLKKRRSEVLKDISKKFDQQQIDKIRKKIG